SEDAVFPLSSNTKPVGGLLAMRLVELGLLGLDDPVGEHLPELAAPRVLARPDGPLEETVPAERAITLRHLLTMTAGFGWAGEGTPLAGAMAAQQVAPGPYAPPMPPDEYLRRLGALPLAGQPGQGWNYHNSSDVLGVLLARATGSGVPDPVAGPATAPLRGPPGRLVRGGPVRGTAGARHRGPVRGAARVRLARVRPGRHRRGLPPRPRSPRRGCAGPRPGDRGADVHRSAHRGAARGRLRDRRARERLRLPGGDPPRRRRRMGREAGHARVRRPGHRPGRRGVAEPGVRRRGRGGGAGRRGGPAQLGRPHRSCGAAGIARLWREPRKSRAIRDGAS